MTKIVCVLYDDPFDRYPIAYARDDIPRIDSYLNGQTAPAPAAIDFKPGALLGGVTAALGLRKYLEDNGHRLVIAPDKDGPDSVFERELADAEVVISQPFGPAYLTAERIANAPKLKLAITAGIGSDHVDLQAAIERNITVAEVTFTMPQHGMTPRGSGTTLSAQARYADGTREILECWFEGRPIRDEYLIVGGAEEATRFRKSAA
jgi:formate dehydrogenase